MKVGILSMQKVMNYGSFLQGFALKKTIEELGHQCEFIDIEQGRVFPELKRSYTFLLKKAVERYMKWDVLTRLRYTCIFQKRFNTEFFNLLGVNTHTITHFDAVVIGSDEVFNFAQRVPWGYTPQLYGKVSNANKVISYAGSFGHTTMQDIEHYGVKDEIKNALFSMAAISVRDKNSYLEETNTYDRIWQYQGIYIDIFLLEPIPYPLAWIGGHLQGQIYNQLNNKALNVETMLRRIQFIYKFNTHIGFPILRFLSKLWPNKALRHTFGTPYFKPRNWGDIFPLSEMEFEGKKFPVPHNTDVFLRKLYGDYMQLPDLNSIHPHYSKLEFYK